MVRGYNPTDNDPVKYLFDSTFRLFRNRPRFTAQQTRQLVQKWFSSDSYDPIFRTFQERNSQPPKVRLLSSCQQPHFPARWEPITNTVGLCMKHIANKIELKENIDREVYLAYSETLRPSGEDEATAMSNLYTSCRRQYSNYVGLSQELVTTMSQKCAKYLFMQRRQHIYPLDAQFRLANRLSRSAN